MFRICYIYGEGFCVLQTKNTQGGAFLFDDWVYVIDLKEMRARFPFSVMLYCTPFEEQQ